MNDELHELERELKRLRPRAVPPRLLAALDAGLAEEPATRRVRSATSWTSWKWVPWAAASLAVLLAATAWLRPRSAPAEPSAAPAPAASAPAALASDFGYKPVAAERTIYDAEDEGLVTFADGTAGRKLRSRYIDTITWRDPASNASLRWSVPSEEVRVVPVRLN